MPVLRAGLGMVEAAQTLMPEAQTGFIGIARNEVTHEPMPYMESLPQSLAGRPVFALDPMLATGGSMAHAIGLLVERGAADVTAICVLAAPEGIARLRASGIEASPCTYNYSGGSIGRTITHRKLYSRVPTRRHVELLARVLPPGVIGLPQYPLRNGYFQVLVLFQLVANALGYKLHHVRELRRDGSGSASSFSDEIVHINGVGTYKRYKESEDTTLGRFYPVLLQADYALLTGLGVEAPHRYRQLRGELEAELVRLGIPLAAVQQNLRAFLAERGIGKDSLDRILGPGEPAATGERTEAAGATGRASA